MAPYCAIRRDYLSDTPILRDMGCLVSQHGQLGAIPPPFFSERFPPWRACEVEVRYPPPLKSGISAILARYPKKTRQMGAIPPSAILSRKGIARYAGVSRTGPLSWHSYDRDVLGNARGQDEPQTFKADSPRKTLPSATCRSAELRRAKSAPKSRRKSKGVSKKVLLCSKNAFRRKKAL